MKKLIFFALVLALLPASALAKKTTYIVTNHRLNYVKLVEVKQSVAEKRGMSHPAEVTEAQMRDMLKSIKLSRGHLWSKEVDTQDTFSESSINFLAPAFVRAFREATPTDEVVFSYLIKDPFFIIRNDRLNLGKAWIHDNQLYIDFQKLYAKVTGNLDARGGEAKAVASARGLRIDLDLQPGQQMDVDDPKILVVDIGHNFAGDAAAVTAAAPEETKETKGKKKSKKEVAKAEDAAAAPAAATDKPDDAQLRLERLDHLRKDGLISEKEYKEKKKEILKDL